MPPSLRVGDLSLSRNFALAASRASASTLAHLLPVVSDRCSSEAASARNSPTDSQRRQFPAVHRCTCLGAEPPTPDSTRPPPSIHATTDRITPQLPSPHTRK